MDRRVAVGAGLLALLTGCQSGITELAMPYVGIWLIASGQDTADCGAGPEAPTPVMGTVLVELGTSTLTLTVKDTNHGTCVWTLAVAGSVATLRSGDPCTASTATTDANVTPKDYVFTLSSSSAATVTSTFDWEMLGVTCRHAQTTALVLMTPP